MLAEPFYVETVGARWTSIPTSWRTLERAEQVACDASRDAMEARVYDCSEGPVGKLVAVYSRGVRVGPGRVAVRS